MTNKKDRYVSFQGIDCDQQASRIIECMQKYIKNSSDNKVWSQYFQVKWEESLSKGQDELNFICSQINNIYSLFEEYNDTEALNLLEKIEEECC